MELSKLRKRKTEYLNHTKVGKSLMVGKHWKRIIKELLKRAGDKTSINFQIDLKEYTSLEWIFKGLYTILRATRRAEYLSPWLDEF